MKFSEQFRAGFLKASDVKAGTIHGTIATIDIEEIGRENKVVIGFDDLDQDWVLNKTNAEVLAGAWGDDMDTWVGKVVALKLGKTKFQGKTVDCIDAEPSDQKPAAPDKKKRRPF